MEGRLRDPLVGRDVLFGVLLGMAWVLVYELGVLSNIRHGAPFALPSSPFLHGTREVAAIWLSIVVNSSVGSALFFFTLVFLRVLLRNSWLAAGAFVLLHVVPRIFVSDYVVADTIVWLTIYIIAAIALVRFGLIVLGVCCFTTNVLANVPFTLDFSNWYAAPSLIIVLFYVALGAWGFYLSLAGKPLWKDELFE